MKSSVKPTLIKDETVFASFHRVKK